MINLEMNKKNKGKYEIEAIVIQIFYDDDDNVSLWQPY